MRRLSAAWSDARVFLKSGIWQTSHKSRTAAPPRARSWISGSDQSARKVSTSSASLARVRPRTGGFASRLAISAGTVPNSSR